MAGAWTKRILVVSGGGSAAADRGGRKSEEAPKATAPARNLLRLLWLEGKNLSRSIAAPYLHYDLIEPADIVRSSEHNVSEPDCRQLQANACNHRAATGGEAGCCLSGALQCWASSYRLTIV